jgi:hypothetical protein
MPLPMEAFMNTKVRKMKSLNFLRYAALFLGVVLTCAVSFGQEALTLPDGAKYIGEVKDGKPNGQGTVTFPDGKKYVGEFKDGKRNGHGTMMFPDGAKHVGKFKDGKPNDKPDIILPQVTSLCRPAGLRPYGIRSYLLFVIKKSFLVCYLQIVGVTPNGL